MHFVWATWDRLPLLTEQVREIAYQSIQAECRNLNADVLAMGGIQDHVHLLVRLPATISAATLANQVKGVSSHLINARRASEDTFKWQGGYAVFSLRAADIPYLQAYIANQEEHHKLGEVERGLELPD